MSNMNRIDVDGNQYFYVVTEPMFRFDPVQISVVDGNQVLIASINVYESTKLVNAVYFAESGGCAVFKDLYDAENWHEFDGNREELVTKAMQEKP